MLLQAMMTVSTSLADYKARMKEGQKAIYYVTADSLNAAKTFTTVGVV